LPPPAEREVAHCSAEQADATLQVAVANYGLIASQMRRMNTLIISEGVRKF